MTVACHGDSFRTIPRVGGDAGEGFASVTGISGETIGNAAETAIDRVIDVLTERGDCDEKSIERARRVTAETEQRLDSVLIRLGMVAERALTEAYAASLGGRPGVPSELTIPSDNRFIMLSPLTGL
jgi:hypothetical protein